MVVELAALHSEPPSPCPFRPPARVEGVADRPRSRRRRRAEVVKGDPRHDGALAEHRETRISAAHRQIYRQAKQQRSNACYSHSLGMKTP